MHWPERALAAARPLRIAVFVVGSPLINLPVSRAAVGTALGLRAAGVPGPGTIAGVLFAVLFALGGPRLLRYEAAVLVRESRSRR